MSAQQTLFPLSIQELQEKEIKLGIEKSLALENAMKGNDVNEIYRAQTYLKKIEEREMVDSKSILVDPMELTSSFGYKDKPFNLSYEVLRAMSRTHLVKAVIGTRQQQVVSFCEPQKDKYSAGFVIAKRQKYTEVGQHDKMSKAEQAKAEWLTEFVLSCGTTKNFWHGDTFDQFIAKLVNDSLTFDQATFEIVRNKKGEIIEFFATDAGSYRIADTFSDDPDDPTRRHEGVEFIQGYPPSYVQLYQNSVVASFYPWELCFGVRNPQSDIRFNGYGRAELEDMITSITALLNADTYNANFFKVGSAPRGILRYSGNVNQNTLEDFRRQWIAQVAGVLNAHKIPMMNADKMEFINTNVPNKDMEYSKYQEFLIKIICAIFKIDPSEIGFSMSGNSEGTQGLGGDNTEEKIKYSRDKGLIPLLKKIQYWINKFIVWQVDPEFEFRFVGYDDEMDLQTELDQDVTALQNFMTLNEVRAKRNLDPIEGGDMPLNPVFMQAQQMKQQADQQDQQMKNDNQMASDERPEGDDEPFGADEDTIDGGADPFLKSLSADLERLLA